MATSRDYVAFLNSMAGSALRRNLQHRICFVHVPKCGGSAIDWAMRECVGLTDRLMGAVSHMEPAPAARAADAMGVDGGELRDHILMYELAKRRARYVSGHFRFPEKENEITRNWHFVTVLRDPVNRWLSQYFYDRNKSSLHAKIDSDIETFLDSERGQHSGNIYVRMFGDRSAVGDEERIVSALHNLERFSVVGVLERPEEFVQRFKRVFGFGLRIGRANIAPMNWQREKMPLELVERIGAVCKLDREVYARIANARDALNSEN